MKSLKNISVFRLSILVAISLYVNNLYLYVLVSLFLLFKNKKESIIYICLIFICLYLPKIDILPFGIVEEIKGNYVIVNKILYKVKLYSTNLKVGDFVKCSKFTINEYSDIKKNILFYGDEYKYINYLRIKRNIYNRLNIFDTNTKAIFLQEFYNIYTYDDFDLNIGYGLPIYYLFKYIEKKNKYLCLFLIVIYSIVFNFQIKFILIIFDILFSDVCSRDRFSYKLLFICLVNINLFDNNGILLPLLISLYSYFDINIDFRLYLTIIESLIFYEFNALSLLLFKPYIYIRILYFILSIFVYMFECIEPLFLSISKYYSLLNDSIVFDVRGQISLFCIVLFLYLLKVIKIDSFYLRYVLLIALILSPLNNPFASVNFIDVGQGDSILISDSMKKGNILLDTGSTFNYYKLNKFLKRKGIYTIDYLIISHSDSDHSGNIDNLERDYKIKNIIDKPLDVKLNNIKMKNYHLGVFDNDNDNSLIYSLLVNKTSFLFTGDISSNVERLFINYKGPINIDVLKASHHGSSSGNSEYFISNIMPKYVIYSTSGQYNHPSKQTIDIMDKYKVKQYSTKDEKDICFVFTRVLSYIKTSNGSVII